MLSPEEQVANHIRELVRLVPGGELDDEICLLTDESLCNAAVHFTELLEAELRQQEQAWVFPDAAWTGQTTDAFASWEAESFDDFNVAVVDTACITTLHGKEWGDKFREHLVIYGLAWQEI